MKVNTGLWPWITLAVCGCALAATVARAGSEPDAGINAIIHGIKVAASNVYRGDTSHYGPQFAFDGDSATRWATDDASSQAWIAADFGRSRRIHGVRISEAYPGRVQNYELQYRDGTVWKTVLTGATLSDDFEITFPEVRAREFRLNILSAKQGPTIREIKWF
jgi:alpha-L-fucosidase